MRTTRPFTLIAAVAVAIAALPAAAQAAPRDRDGDGMPDRWERRNHVRSANADPDRDRVDNRNEYVEGTLARDADSDNDRRRDGREDRDRDRLNNAAEDATGNDPTDRDTDDDGILDSLEQAGVVSAYVDGVLTIDLANGSSVTAAVTEETDVDCATEAVAQRGGHGRPFRCYSGISQSGNQRAVSSSKGSSIASWALRRNSRSVSRCCSPPEGTKG